MGAIPFLLGARLGLTGPTSDVPWLVAVLVLGMTLTGHRRVIVCWLALGWGWVAHSPSHPTISHVGFFAVDKPTTVTGTVRGCWQQTPTTWNGVLVRLTVEQQGLSATVRGPLSLTLPDLPDTISRCGGTVRAVGYVTTGRVFENSPRILVGREAMRLKSPRLLSGVAKPGATLRWFSVFKERVSPKGWMEHSSPGKRLAHALVLGEGYALDPSWREGLRRYGLSHVVAVSGLHMGILGGLICLGTVNIRREIRWTLVLGGVLTYAFLVGPRPSVLRSVFMASVVAISVLAKRPPQSANILALALGTLVALDPSRLLDLGFQLSASATAGILLLTAGTYRNLESMSAALFRASWYNFPDLGSRSGRVSESLRPVARWLLQGLAVSVAAQTATLPWTLGVFHWWSPSAVVLNLLAVPWAALSVSLSILWLVSDWIYPTIAAGVIEPTLDVLTRPLEILYVLEPGLFSGRCRVVAPWAIGLGVGALGWWGFRPSRSKLHLIWPLVAVAAIHFGESTANSDSSKLASLPAGGVRISAIDVGQGDALLLESELGNVLIDGGGWIRPGLGARVLAPALAGRGIVRLDAAVISHADVDHCYGLLELARVIPVRRFVVAQSWASGSGCDQGLEELGVIPFPLEVGQSLRVGSWDLVALGPLPGMKDRSNAQSLVVRASALGRCVLLTGDIGAAEEEILRSFWGDGFLQCEMLKVAHHGARSASFPGWLNTVKPKIALISAGRNNPFGHPSTKVLQRLSNRGIWALRTDLDGQVSIAWNREIGRRVALGAD